MAVQPGYLEYVLEQLASLPALRSNRMFGGIGLYSDGIFFGLIDDDTLFFKTNDGNIAPYRERNMPRFMPFPDRPEAVLGYHQVPADVIEDAETLVEWARSSVEVGLAAKAAKAKPVRQKSGTPAAKPAKRSAAKKSAQRRPAKKSSAKKSAATTRRASPRKKSRR
jgi:DNA transformation protein